MAHKSLAQLLLALAVCTRDLPPTNFPTCRLFLQPGGPTLTLYRGGGEWDGVGAESQLIYSVSPNQQKDATASKGAHNFGELIYSVSPNQQTDTAASKGAHNFSVR